MGTWGAVSRLRNCIRLGGVCGLRRDGCGANGRPLLGTPSEEVVLPSIPRNGGGIVTGANEKTDGEETTICVALQKVLRGSCSFKLTAAATNVKARIFASQQTS